MKKPNQGDIVLITFLDAFGRGSWNCWANIEAGLKNHILCEIVGYYTTEDENFVVLSMGIQNDPNANPFLHLEFIPKGAIKSIEFLSPSKGRDKKEKTK